MSKTNGIVFSIHKFALHDGPGIRTTVFLKGCPLKCKWCHNPESMQKEPEIIFYKDKCVLCGACVDVCPKDAHQISNNTHFYDRVSCNKSGKCVKACLYDALKMTGNERSVEDVMSEVLKDKSYYKESNGGLTISGGEPMLQFDFTMELLKESKNKNIHTCLDTSGLASQKLYEQTLPLVDLYLFDYKATTEEEHKDLTGVSNKLILSNLDFLYSKGANIEIRCPLVPGINDNEKHLKSIAELEKKYPKLKAISIMPFHNTGKAKFERYAYENPLPDLETTSKEIKLKWMNFFKKEGCKKVGIQD